MKLLLGKAKENEEEDTINSFTTSGDGKFVVTHHKSSLFKLWNATGKPYFHLAFDVFFQVLSE